MTDKKPPSTILGSKSPRFVVMRGAEAVGRDAYMARDERNARAAVAILNVGGQRLGDSTPFARVLDAADGSWFVVDSDAPAVGWCASWAGTADDSGDIEPITMPALIENIGKPFPASVTDAWKGAWSRPAPPTDAEIVESYTRWQNANDGDPQVNAPIEIRGHRIGMVEFRAAWSRVLAAKVAASDEQRRERDRRVVMGPIDDPEEA